MSGHLSLTCPHCGRSTNYDLSTVPEPSTAPPHPGLFTLTGRGRVMDAGERAALWAMADRRGTPWSQLARKVEHYTDGLALAELLKKVPKQEQLDGLPPTQEQHQSAQRQKK